MNNNNDDQQLPQQQINIELGEKEAEGIYSNFAILTHSPAEFILDFTRIFPGTTKAKVMSRIIMTPQHAKMFLNAFKQTVENYENQFGEINLNSMNHPSNQGFGFQVPQKPKKDEKIN